jgi:DNA-binding FadR family transcriptional regulator
MLDCKHNLKTIRERIKEAIELSSAYAFLSLRFKGESLETIVDALVTHTSAVAGTIMAEHGDEIIEEMKRFLNDSKGGK